VSLVESAPARVDPELQRCVERIVDESDAPAKVADVKRTPAWHWGSYDNAILTVRLADGDELRLFLKDFGRSRLPKDAAAERRDRELRVYADLLHGAGLGTARFHGAHWDDAVGRHWLFLEFVDGEPLRYCPFERWLEAAAWLGCLHGHFAAEQRRLPTCRFLARHDADFFRHAGERALEAVSGLSTGLASRLAALLVTYDEVAPVLARDPDALVHGSFRPQNVLVAGKSTPARICPTDWELAAIGRSGHDLAFLVDGFDAPRLEALFAAYEREAERSGFLVRDPDGLRREVECFRLHKAISSLGHLRQWPHPADTADKVLSTAERIAATLR
jgi:aminoglycoside phosphotransferase (APT) family kinase protein